MPPAAAQHVVDDWWYDAPSGAPGELYVYTDRLSYAPGEEADLHVYAAAPSWSLRIRRDGAEPGVVHEAQGLPGATPATPADCSAAGCGWPVAHRVPIGPDW